MIQTKKIGALALGAILVCSAGATASAHSSRHSGAGCGSQEHYAYCQQDNCFESVCLNADGSYTCPNGHTTAHATSHGQYHQAGHHSENHHR